MALRITTTENGVVEGIPGGNPCYTVFKGIPYAAPPVGALRWRPPRRAENWEGVYHADRFSRIAPQVRHPEGSLYQKEFFQYPEEMSEDCLYLNIWTPANSDSERLPVLFWIHGGALSGGYSFEPEFDGEAFCRQGVIVVTINYRVGVLGFLAHPELTKESGTHSSGNYGHMDQVAALKWVRRNIAAFGGDPENITVAGQSSGAISAQILLCAEASRQDISKAVLQSAGGVWAGFEPYSLSREETEKLGEAYMKKMGCTSIEEMRRLPWEEIVAGQPSQPYEAKFATCIDGSLLREDPVQMLLQNDYAETPCLIGNTSVEMTFTVQADPEEFRQKSYARYAERTEEYLKLVKTQEDMNRICGMADIMSVSNRTFAELKEQQGRQKAYVYYFNREVPGEDHRGAFHSSELWYVFGTLQRCWRPMNGIDYDLSDVMVRYWSNFAKTGNPNGDGPETWEAYSAEKPGSMILGEKPHMEMLKEHPDQTFTKNFFLEQAKKW